MRRSCGPASRFRIRCPTSTTSPSVVERLEGNNAFLLGLGRTSGQVLVIIDGWYSTINGLSMVDGKWTNENETQVKGAAVLKQGASHHPSMRGPEGKHSRSSPRAASSSIGRGT
jgi:hypothetical protein